MTTKPLKRDTKLVQSNRTASNGKKLFHVYRISPDRQRYEDEMFGPALWKDCVAWRKEHTA